MSFPLGFFLCCYLKKSVFLRCVFMDYF
uniref:Uncharacterized protein n=1 Tax=Anguilla anguilla TaxID=7936 RepID=A0A0E9QJX3_ANGAN